MKKILLFLTGILLSVGAMAQYDGASDSILTYRPALLEYKRATHSIAGLESYAPLSVGIVSLTGTNEAGGFRLAQAPQKHSVVSFETEGIKSVNRFRLFGKFTYSRTWDDSLAWSQIGIPDNNRPFYFASQKAGKYDRQYYNMNGRMAYALKPGKLYVGSGIDYLYNTAFRSVDPRPAVKNFSITLSPEFAWQHRHHMLGLMPVWGYGYENSTINYKNSAYQNNFDKYPERRTWLMMGMGYMQPRSGNNEQMSVRTHTTGISINDLYNNGNWTLNTLLSWKRDKAEYYNPKDNSLQYSEWGTYTLQQYNVKILAQQQLRHSLSVNAGLQRGADLNTYSVLPLVPALNASNYKYRYKHLNITYNHLHKTDRALTPGWGAALQWEDESKKDFVTAHRLGHSNITPTASGELYGHAKNGDRFNVKLSAGMRFPLSQNVTVLPTQLTAFSTDVVYHDYYYWSAKTGIAELHAQYITRKILSTLPLGLSINMQYNRAMNGETPVLPEVPPVGQTRLLTNFSIQLFL